MPDARLKMVYSLIPGGVLCDIGADHCRLPVLALQSGLCPRAVATDLRPGPLSAAKRTVERYGLEDKITLVLSDGFENVPDGLFDSVDCFVIAGMGGELIERIIRGRFTDKPLVLQPQSAVYDLARFLDESGYRVEKRLYCREGDKLYTALRCRYDGVRREFDPFFAAVRDENYYEYLEKERTRINTALAGMSRAAEPEPRARELSELAAMIEKELER